MTLIKTALLLFLISLSFTIFADTYLATVAASSNVTVGASSCNYITCPASYSGPDVASNCSHYSALLKYSYAKINTGVSTCTIVDATDGSFYASIQVVFNPSCPYGGTLSGTSCIDAPACLSPNFRLSSGQCVVPTACALPMVLDTSTNACINKTCPSGQIVLGAQDNYACGAPGLCPAVMPLCSTPAYTCKNADGTLSTISACARVCPVGQHLVGTDCLPDEQPPPDCPPDMQPNSSGSCEAVPAVKCPDGYRPGTVNGATFCMPAGSVAPGSKAANQETAVSTGTQTSQTVTKDTNGNVTSTSTTTTTTINNTLADTANLSQQSTTQGILDAITGNGSKGSWSQSSSGAAPAFSDVDTQIASDKAALLQQFNTFKTSLRGLIAPLSGSAAISCDEGFTLSNGVHGSICFSSYSSNLSKIGTLVLFIASVSAVMMVIL